MNMGRNSSALAPLNFLEAVAAHNLRVFVDGLKSASLDHVVVIAAGPDSDGVPSPALVDCMTETGRRTSPETWLPDVGGLVAPFQDDEDGRWRACSSPSMSFREAAETVAVDLLETIWVRSADAVDRVEISAEGAVLRHGVVDTGLMEPRVVEVPETPQAGLEEILDIPDGDSRAIMEEAAFRHNLAVVLGAMQDAGIEEVVLRTGSSLSSRRLPVIEWHGEDGGAAEVYGIVSPQPLTGGGWKLVEFGYPLELETVLSSLAARQLTGLDEEWFHGSGSAEVHVTDKGLHASFEREITQRIRDRSMTAPERVADVAPPPPRAEESTPGPDM